MADNDNKRDGNGVPVPFASDTPTRKFAAALVARINRDARSLAVGAGRFTLQPGTDGRPHFTFSFWQDRPGREGAMIKIEPDEGLATITGPSHYPVENEAGENNATVFVLTSPGDDVPRADSDHDFCPPINFENVVATWRDYCFKSLSPHMPGHRTWHTKPSAPEARTTSFIEKRDEFIQAADKPNVPAHTWWTVDWEKGVPHLAIYHGSATGEPPFATAVFFDDHVRVSKHEVNESFPQAFFVHTNPLTQWGLFCARVDREMAAVGSTKSPRDDTGTDIPDTSFIELPNNSPLHTPKTVRIIAELSKYHGIAPAFFTFEVLWDSGQTECVISGKCGDRSLIVKSSLDTIRILAHDAPNPAAKNAKANAEPNEPPPDVLARLLPGADEYRFEDDYIPCIRQAAGTAIFSLFAPDLAGTPQISDLTDLLMAATPSPQDNEPAPCATWSVVRDEEGKPRLHICSPLRTLDTAKAPIIEATLVGVGQLEITRPGETTTTVQHTTNAGAVQLFTAQCGEAVNAHRETLTRRTATTFPQSVQPRGTPEPEA